MLDKDANSRDLETYLGQGVSGEYDLGTSTAFAPFQELNLYQIPAEVMDQVNEVQISTRMGLLAEINHAWVAVDNQLYLWDYTASSPELKGYEQNPNTIISVKLVKPRPQVFQDVISYLLVVATTQEVLLIGVQCERGPEGVHSVQLYETNLAVTVRGILVGPIIGSPRTGRIFFADGRDSEDVYELNYQQEDRWFSSRCSKTNHVKKAITLPALPFYSSTNSVYITQMEVDDTRNVLYTLSSNGTIRVFHMKTATTLDQVITLRMPTLKQNCSHMVGRQAEMLKDLTISGISTITASEATNLSLVATTSNGVRIYLSTTSSGYYSDPTAAPTSIQVRHMRFPPLENQGANQSPSNQVQSFQNTTPVGFDSQYLSKTFKAFRFAPGSFFCFVSKGDNNASHMLFMSAPHVGQATQQEQAQAQRFRENAQALDLRGLVQDVGLATEPFSAAGRPLGFGNELAVQFDKPPCEYAILTHNGIKTVRRRRLVDIFATIIKDGGGPDGIQANLNEIARQYGKAEMASTALAVACGQGSDSNANRSSDPEVLDLARKAFIEEGGRAQLDQNAPTVEGLSVDNVRASPRHDGIAMYVSRLVRSIWRSPIVREAKGPNGLVLLSTHKITKLQSIQRALIELQRFLDLNKVDIEGLNGPDAMGRLSSRQEELVLQGENRALTSLLQLINNIIEGISFVLVLLDERLEDITKLLPVDSQAKVRQLTFEGLFSVRQGKDLAKELVKAIVSLNIAKGSNVETVAEGLRRKCGSFCSSDDVVIFKAQENLKKAADAGANAERGRLLLNDSMRLFEQVASSLSEEHLNLAMSQYIELEFYAGKYESKSNTVHTNGRRCYTPCPQGSSRAGPRQYSHFLD
jgi:nuclear pore complex protein Nup155